MKWHVPVWGDFCWESNAEKWGDHWKRNFLINNSVGLSMYDNSIETVKYISVNIWCMLDWMLSQMHKCTSFAYNWSTSKNCENLDAVVPEQLLATKADTVAYHKNTKIQVWLWFCIVWTISYTTTMWNFHYYKYYLGKSKDKCHLIFLIL